MLRVYTGDRVQLQEVNGEINGKRKEIISLCNIQTYMYTE